MKIPKNTELSLKTIVEGMEQISLKVGQAQPEAMTPEMKKTLKEMAYMFNEYGSAFEGAQKMMESAEAISKFLKLAETYAIQEGQDVFDQNIIKENFKEAGKKAQVIQKLAQECYVRNQQLACAFDDLRHIVSRYYKVGDPTPKPNTNPETK